METKNKLTGKDIETLIQEYPNNQEQLAEAIQKRVQDSYLKIDKVRAENTRQEKKYHVLESVSLGVLGAYVVGGFAVAVNLMNPDVDLSPLETMVSTLGIIGGGGIIGGIKIVCREKKEKYGNKLGIEYYNWLSMGGWN